MELTTPYDRNARMPDGFDAPKKKPKPSRMPNLSYGKDKRTKPRPSVISTSESINILAVLKQELQKVNCILQNYFIRSHVRGVDIEKIKVFCSDVRELRNKVTDMDSNDLIDHDRMQKVTSLALIAVAKNVKNRLENELRLETQIFDFEDSEYGVMSVTIPVEKPEPPMPAMPPPMALPPPPAASDNDLGMEDEEIPEDSGEPLPGSEDQVYTPEDGEMDLGNPNEEALPGASQPLPGEGEEELPGEVRPEDEIGRASNVPELI